MKKLILLALAMMCAVASWAATRAEFAYALSAEQEGNIATFTFQVTGDVIDSRIILTSTSSYGTVEIPVGEVTAATGASVKHDMSALAAGDYTWSVEVTSAPIASSGRFINKPDSRTSAFRGGVVCITDPESDSYGYTVIGAAQGKGFLVFDPTGAQVGTGFYQSGWAAHNASPYRGGQLDGKAIFSDYKDAHSGYWVFDPLNPETTVKNLLEAEGFYYQSGTGTIDGLSYTAGMWTNDATYSAGNATCAAFYKDAEGTHLITFGEDLGNKLVRYTLDAKGLISSKPDKVGISIKYVQNS